MAKYRQALECRPRLHLETTSNQQWVKILPFFDIEGQRFQTIERLRYLRIVFELAILRMSVKWVARQFGGGIETLSHLSQSLGPEADIALIDGNELNEIRSTSFTPWLTLAFRLILLRLVSIAFLAFGMY